MTCARCGDTTLRAFCPASAMASPCITKAEVDAKRSTNEATLRDYVAESMRLAQQNISALQGMSVTSAALAASSMAAVNFTGTLSSHEDTYGELGTTVEQAGGFMSEDEPKQVDPVEFLLTEIKALLERLVAGQERNERTLERLDMTMRYAGKSNSR